MESVHSEDEFQSLKNNRVIGNPKLINSTVNFTGVGNVLYCENNVHIMNSYINFGGNNCLIYLSSSNSAYPLNLQVFHDSVVYIGKNNNMAAPININIQEHQNLIIGDDGIIGSGTNIRTSDASPIFDIETKRRINHSRSVYIGDHVWLGHLSYISRGVEIGSGSILSNNSHVEANEILGSNKVYSGNPSREVKDDVFFTNTYVGAFTKEDSSTVEDYTSRIYSYSYKPGESLSSEKLDEIFDRLSVEDKIEFIQKLFVQNKKHDRFSI